MQSKILLIAPFQKTNYPQPPLGLAIIGAVLHKNGYTVKILDLTALGLINDSVVSVLTKEKPNIVGITAVTPTIDSAIILAKKIKEFDKKIIVILGGPHATILPEETLQEVPEIDFIVEGEGENTIIELIKTLNNNELLRFHKISGLTFRDQKKIVRTSSRTPIMDLDNLPFPAFHLLPIEKYNPHPPFGKGKPFMTIMTSRGCPYDCIFCSKSIFGNKYRVNSTKYVVNEIKFLIDRFKIKEIKFYDDVFTLNRKWVLELCQSIRKEKIDIPWTCETRVNLVNKDLLRNMRAAGCYMMSYGVESGNQTILDKLNKNITLNQAINAFKHTKEAGIQTVGYFMIGAPGEKPETIMDTITFAKKLDADFVQFSIATPYPGTKLHEIASQRGFLPKKWKDYFYANLENFDNSTVCTKTLSRKELRKWNSRAYVSFYIRLNYLLKRIKTTTSVSDLKTNASGLRLLIEALT